MTAHEWWWGLPEAMKTRCGLCGAKAGEPCRNTIQPGQPLPGRQVHHYRIEGKQQ